MTNTLVVTARFDDESFTVFDGLRRRHFPAHLNRIPAHLTLFHKLPGEALEDLRRWLGKALAGRPPFSATTSGVRFLGRGVALEVACPELVKLRAAMAEHRKADLTPQDAQGFRPHVTIQNKADPAEAKALYEAVRASFQPCAFEITGIDIWHYRDGPWEIADSLNLSGISGFRLRI